MELKKSHFFLFYISLQNNFWRINQQQQNLFSDYNANNQAKFMLLGHFFLANRLLCSKKSVNSLIFSKLARDHSTENVYERYDSMFGNFTNRHQAIHLVLYFCFCL